MALIDPGHRLFAHPDRLPPPPTMEAATVNRQSLADSPWLQAEIVTIRNLGPTGIPFVTGPRPLALIPLSGALYLDRDGLAVWMDLNQILLVSSGMAVTQRHPTGGDVAYLSIGCPPGPPEQPGHCFALPIDPGLQREAARLATLVVSHRALPPAASEAALRTILNHLSGLERPQRSPAPGRRALTLVQSVRELVQEAGTPRSLEDLARRVGVSPVYLTSLFRQIEGMPIYRYQARLRLARSLRRLGETDDITTVAMDLGFANHSHFSTAFRTAFGLTPSAYRASLELG